MMKTLAIIGTAGRRDDSRKLSPESFSRMCNAAKGLWTRLQMDEAVSGGAAWGDHVLVALVLDGVIPADRVTLHLPAPLNAHGFHGTGPQSPGGIANHYHRAFSRCLKQDSLAQIRAVIEMGAKGIVYPGGMMARNAGIAMACNGLDDAMLAFTFGSGTPWTIKKHSPETNSTTAGLNHMGTGTKDTWNRAHCRKFHACLGPLK